MREWFFSITPIALVIYFMLYPAHLGALLLHIRYYMY